MRPNKLTVLSSFIFIAFLLFVNLAHAQGSDTISETKTCIKERVTYESDGISIVAYIMRPKGEGPFPTLIYNHHSRIYNGRDYTRDPTVNMAKDCWPPVRKGIAIFAPEGRGYGGSGGKSAFDEVMKSGNSESYIVNRARDTNAGVRWLIKNKYIATNCMVLVGYSHGGVVTLIASPYLEVPGINYRAAIAVSTGMSYITREALSVGMKYMEQAIEKTPFPIHIWHVKNDTLVTPEVSRRLANFAKAHNRDVTHIEFDGKPNVEGHFAFGFETGFTNYDIWGKAYEAVLDTSFKECR